MFVLVFASIPSIAAQELGSQNQELRRALDEALPTTTALNEPGHILRIVKNNSVIYQAESGAADIEQARHITDETVFHIASLSKQITAAALVHAIEDGLLSLDDPVEMWIPETRKYGGELTIAHLVYMTSGLTEYTDLPRPGGRPWATFHYFTIDDAINASLSVDSLQFTPGSEWAYSNTNYMLIARIIERAYQKPFSDTVHHKVFAPLGMTSSLINDDITAIIPNRANAYLPRSERVLAELTQGAGVDAKYGDDLIMIRRNSPHYGGSGVMTSMNDWTKWQSESLNQSVFGDGFWEKMKSRRLFDHDKNNDALGLVFGEINGLQSIWYSGGDIDASAYSVLIPDQALMISCFSNNPLDSCGHKAQIAIDVLIHHGELNRLSGTPKGDNFE
ncbi:MAG: serine hydrolase domain-containing protein [Pseudomonadota bacterium]